MTTKFVAVCIEDDDDIRLLFRHVVGGLGGVLIEAVNANDGLRAIQRHQPHLILLDLALPGKSGWVVVDGMHADQEMQDIPVIVVSIRDQAEEQFKGQHVDWVEDYITKPFGMAELEASINKALGF
jgi:DNA-binding response OmpR family regulator